MNIKGILRLLMKPLSPLNAVLPKNSRRIVLYSNLGFRDNVKSMYDYLIENGYNRRYKIICSVDDKKNFDAVDLKNVKFVGNKAGLFYFLLSKYMFYSFGKYPVKPSKKQTVVNLWHGMPLKTVGNLEKGCEKNDYFFFTYTIATSEFFRDVMCKCFSCPADRVLLCGQPRCDVLFDKSAPHERLILWLPTYRASDRLSDNADDFQNGKGFPLIENDEQLAQLDNLLGENGYTMLIKPHPLQNLSGGISGCANIALRTERELSLAGENIYDMFLKSAALITDYSSVFFDYLLLDRPIGFTTDDFDSYKNGRGFVTDDPEKLMPGMKIKSFSDMLEFISQVCGGNDAFKEQRKAVNATVNSHQTGRAAEKILTLTGIENE